MDRLLWTAQRGTPASHCNTEAETTARCSFLRRVLTGETYEGGCMLVLVANGRAERGAVAMIDCVWGVAGPAS